MFVDEDNKNSYEFMCSLTIMIRIPMNLYASGDDDISDKYLNIPKVSPANLQSGPMEAQSD